MSECYIEITGPKWKENGKICQKYAIFGPFDDPDEALSVGDFALEHVRWDDEEEEGDEFGREKYCSWTVNDVHWLKNWEEFDYPPEFLENRDMVKWVKKHLSPDKF